MMWCCLCGTGGESGTKENKQVEELNMFHFILLILRGAIEVRSRQSREQSERNWDNISLAGGGGGVGGGGKKYSQENSTSIIDALPQN